MFYEAVRALGPVAQHLACMNDELRQASMQRLACMTHRQLTRDAVMTSWRLQVRVASPQTLHALLPRPREPAPGVSRAVSFASYHCVGPCPQVSLLAAVRVIVVSLVIPQAQFWERALAFVERCALLVRSLCAARVHTRRMLHGVWA